MIKTLVRKFGLDRIGDLVADEARRVQLEVLREEHEILAWMITKLDERIAGLGGKRRGRPSKAAVAPPPIPTRKPRRRRRIVHAPGETLRDMVVKALSKAGGPVKAPTLVELVKELGYRTTAKPSTLLTSIYHVLVDKKLFRKMGKGGFGLKAVTAPTRSAKSEKREKFSKRTRKPGTAPGKKRAKATRRTPRPAAEAQRRQAVEQAGTQTAEVTHG